MSLFDDAVDFGIGYYVGKYILFPILILCLVFWVLEKIWSGISSWF